MKKVLLLFLLLIFMMGFVYAGPKYFDDGKKNVPPHPVFNNTTIVPVGYVLPITIRNSINSADLSIADSVDAVLHTDFYYKDKLIAAEGSSVIGMVVKNTVSKDKDTELFIRFTSIVNQNGQMIPIAGIFKTPDKTGILRSKNGQAIDIKPDSTLDLIIMQPVTFVSRE